MSELLDRLTPENEATYDSLMSLIENNQDRLALILVACDDLRLRQQIIDRYEIEASQAKIKSFRIVLGTEPSLRAGLAELKLNEGSAAVVTVTGAEWLLRVKMREEDEQSDLDKFFGYLQWTREGLREFQCPIVLWVTHHILQEINLKSPDFWSWRKAVLKFASEDGEASKIRDNNQYSRTIQTQINENALPPLQELLSEIQQLESTAPESANLATLYQKLGQIYEMRIANRKSSNLEEERQQAIHAFQHAINRFQALDDVSDLIDVLIRFGNFLASQSRYENALELFYQALQLASEIGDREKEALSRINCGYIYNLSGQYQKALNFYQQSLQIAHDTSDREREAISLLGSGNAYYNSGRYQSAIDFYQQSLQITREVNAHRDEACILGNLGNVYYKLGQYQRAIDFDQQSLEIKRDLNDRAGEAASLNSLGNAYYSLGQYQRAIDFYRQSLKINREIGNRHEEAIALFNEAIALAKYESRRFEAITVLKQAREIYAELQLEHEVETCDSEIYAFNQIITTQEPQRAPRIDDAGSARKINRKAEWILWFCIGLTITLLIAWLLK